MKILVIDDSPLHHASARQTLGGHEVTIASTYDEAHRLLNGVTEGFTHESGQSFEAVLSDLLMPASEMTMGPEGEKYVGQEMPVGFALSLMAALNGAKYVAVVTDTNHHDHPASAMLDAFASRCPHEHGTVGRPPRFVINEAKVGYYHSPMTFVEGTTCPDCNGTGSKKACYCVERNAGSPKPDCDTCKGTGSMCWTCRNSGKQWGKDWGKVLHHLVS